MFTLAGVAVVEMAEGQLANRFVSPGPTHRVLWLLGPLVICQRHLVLFHLKFQITPEDADTREPSGAQGVGNKVREGKKGE